MPDERVPHDVEQWAGLYRAVLAEISGPVLVIVDNAYSEAQVRPLLPGAGSHRVVVTSRQTLAGLDARLVDVTVLEAEASVGLLDAALRTSRPDDDRITADLDATGRLATECGGLPLALQITAALLKADPALSAAELAEELAVESARLDQLAYDDASGHAAPSVAAAFELSYRRLEEIPARVFRLLPVNPGPDASTAAAAVIADLPVSDLRKTLAGLVQAHLVEAAPGGPSRWRMHDLLRLYAERLSNAHGDTDEGEQARDRLLGYYLKMSGMAVKQFTDRDSGLAWLDAERANMVAAVTIAADTGRDQVAMELPLVLAGYFDWRRRFDDLLATTTISLDVSRRLGDKHHEGRALGYLGYALRQVRRFKEAITALQDALAIYRETGDRHGEGLGLDNLGTALREAGRPGEAITALRDAAAIYRDTGDRHGEGMALNNLGITLRGRGGMGRRSPRTRRLWPSSARPGISTMNASPLARTMLMRSG